jgi:hypothetical protein
MMVRRAKATLECPIVLVGNKMEPTRSVGLTNGSKQRRKVNPPLGAIT